MRVLVVVLPLLGCAGCDTITGVGSLHEVPSPEEGGAALDADRLDATDGGGDTGAMPADASPDAALPPGCGPSACSPDAASVWMPVGYLPGASIACPAGAFALDLVAAVTADPGACTCSSCTLTAPASCAGTSTSYRFGDSDAGPCSASTGSATADVCTPLNGGSVPATIRSSPPAAVGGACSSAAALNAGRLKVTTDRVCVPCTAGACAPASPPFLACVAAEGVQSCPAGGKPVVLGATFTATCPTCDCAVSGTCGGTLTGYSGSNCSGKVANVLQVDGTCYPQANAGTVIASFIWTSGPNAACTGSFGGESRPTINLVSQITICCP